MDHATPDPYEDELRRADALKFDARHEEAIAILEAILVQQPDHVLALEEIADHELSLGRMRRAERAATDALALDPESVAAHYVLGFIASHEERWNDSLRFLRQANALEPNDAEILRCLGWSLSCGGQEVEGLVTLERALNLQPENPLILCDLGVICLRRHDMAKATALFQRALIVEPENERAKECLAMVHHLEKALRGTKQH